MLPTLNLCSACRAAVEEGDLLAFDLEVDGEQGAGDGVGIGFVGAEFVELSSQFSVLSS